MFLSKTGGSLAFTCKDIDSSWDNRVAKAGAAAMALGLALGHGRPLASSPDLDITSRLCYHSSQCCLLASPLCTHPASETNIFASPRNLRTRTRRSHHSHGRHSWTWRSASHRHRHSLAPLAQGGLGLACPAICTNKWAQLAKQCWTPNRALMLPA